MMDELQEITAEQATRQAVAKRNHDRHLSDIQQLLKTAHGRRYIWQVLSSCGVMSSSMRSNPYDMAFREGQRSIGMAMMQDIMEAKPEAYDQMRRENASNMKTEEALLNKELQKMEGFS